MSDEFHKAAASFRDYQSGQINDWCPGCGDHGILRALEKAMAALGLETHQVAAFGGIGCSGKTPYYLNSNGIHTLHGRVLSFAAGAKLANPELTVIALGGDGDGLSIGAGHFVNSGRRNLDMTYILFNNGVYGLTKGQAAPTLRAGEKTRSMPRSTVQGHLDPVLLALAAGYTWVGRGYAYDVPALAELVAAAIQHPGVAFLDVLQPCPKYNDLHTKEWYSGRLYILQDEGYEATIAPDCDQETARMIRQQGMARAQEWGDRIPLGIFLQDLSQPDFARALAQQQPGYARRPPCRQAVAGASGQSMVDPESLFAGFKL